MGYNKENIERHLDKNIRSSSLNDCKIVLFLSGDVVSKLDEARKTGIDNLTRAEFIASLLEYYFR